MEKTLSDWWQETYEALKQEWDLGTPQSPYSYTSVASIKPIEGYTLKFRRGEKDNEVILLNGEEMVVTTKKVKGDLDSLFIAGLRLVRQKVEERLAPIELFFRDKKVQQQEQDPWEAVRSLS